MCLQGSLVQPVAPDALIKHDRFATEKSHPDGWSYKATLGFWDREVQYKKLHGLKVYTWVKDDLYRLLRGYYKVRAWQTKNSRYDAIQGVLLCKGVRPNNTKEGFDQHDPWWSA